MQFGISGSPTAPVEQEANPDVVEDDDEEYEEEEEEGEPET